MWSLLWENRETFDKDSSHSAHENPGVYQLPELEFSSSELSCVGQHNYFIPQLKFSSTDLSCFENDVEQVLPDDYVNLKEKGGDEESSLALTGSTSEIDTIW